MLCYGVGHCLLILAVGTSAGAAKHLIGSTRMHSANLYMKKAAGALLTGVGLYIGPRVDYLTAERNIFSTNLKRAVQDESSGEHNKIDHPSLQR